MLIWFKVGFFILPVDGELTPADPRLQWSLEELQVQDLERNQGFGPQVPIPYHHIYPFSKVTVSLSPDGTVPPPHPREVPLLSHSTVVGLLSCRTVDKVVLWFPLCSCLVVTTVLCLWAPSLPWQTSVSWLYQLALMSAVSFSVHAGRHLLHLSRDICAAVSWHFCLQMSRESFMTCSQ